MQIFKIKVHSIVDLITNSSTVIFTYSEGSLSAVKNLVNEMLKVFNQELTFDDLFYAKVLLDNFEHYTESEDCPEEFNYGNDKSGDKFEEFINNIIKGNIKKPEWMNHREEEEHWSGYPQSTSLYLIPKDEKYSELANKLLKYLYSTDHEATRDG